MLDTKMASYLIKGKSAPLRAKLLSVPLSQLCISAVTQGELLFGLAKKAEAVALKIAVREFLVRLDILPWGSAAAERYGVLRARLEARGTPMGNLDMMIAAHALAKEAFLVTNDRAFSRVEGLTVENWTKT